MKGPHATVMKHYEGIKPWYITELSTVALKFEILSLSLKKGPRGVLKSTVEETQVCIFIYVW